VSIQTKMVYTVGTYQFPIGSGLYNLWQSIINGTITFATQNGKTVFLNNGQIIPDSDKVAWVIDNYQSGISSLGTTNYTPNKPGVPNTLLLSDLFALYTAQNSSPAVPVYPFTSHPTLHLNNDILVTDDTADFGAAAVTINNLSMNGNQICNVADGSTPTCAATVNQLNGAVTTLNSTISSNQSATDSSIAAVQGQVTTILSGASSSLDTLKKITDYYTSLDQNEQLSLSNQVTYLTGLINNEQSRASSAETTLTTNLTSEISRATNQEMVNMRRTEFELKLLPTISVTSDGDLPAPIPASVKTNTSFTGHDGWYFKNSGISGNKVNWYLPGTSILTGASLRGFAMDCTLISTASPPIVTIYSVPKKDGTDAASWYNAKQSWAVNDTTQLTAFKDYTFYTNNNNPYYVEPGYTTFALTLQTAFSKGTIAATDQILTISVGTNSAASAGQAEFVLSKGKCAVNNMVTWSYIFSDYPQETAALTSSLSTLTTTASSISSSLSAEVTRAQAAEATLTSSVQSEVTARTAAITSVQNSVSSEVSWATAAESSITSAATALTTRVTNLEAQVEQLYQVFYAVSRTATL
jgi:hypothetical protein